MSEPAFFLHGPTTSTGGAAIMIIVSGPEAARIGVHGRENLFGPGFRANATIGRTIEAALLASAGRDSTIKVWEGHTLDPEQRERRRDEESLKVTLKVQMDGHRGDITALADPSVVEKLIAGHKELGK